MTTESDMCCHGALEVHEVTHFELTFTNKKSYVSFKLTTPILESEPRSVLSKVSGATPTLKNPPSSFSSNSVTVKHAPLTLMESPMWQSSSTGALSAMTMLHPPPPDSVVSSGEMEWIRPWCST